MTSRDEGKEEESSSNLLSIRACHSNNHPLRLKLNPCKKPDVQEIHYTLRYIYVMRCDVFVRRDEMDICSEIIVVTV